MALQNLLASAHAIEREASEHRGRIRQQIAHMEVVNAQQRRRERLNDSPLIEAENRELEARFANLPPLPPRLPRPEYAAKANSVGQDDAVLDFYRSCEQGRIGEVIAFIRTRQPTQAIRQYGLEQASFGNQPVVARYLLENGTVLHGNAFERSEPGPSDGNGKDVNIFQKYPKEKDLLPLMEVFLSAGWHPTQAWNAPTYNTPMVPFSYPACICNKPLVKFLLSHGADPNLGRYGGLLDGTVPLNRRSGEAFTMAVKAWDPSLLELLVLHGAGPSNASPLLSLVDLMFLREPANPPVPFSQRRTTAEYLLTLDGVGINDVKRMPYRHMLSVPRPRSEDETALTYACAAQDWELVEWLLERGADPEMLDGKALKMQWWMAPYFGPNDPEIVKELVEKVKKRLYQSALGDEATLSPGK